MPGREGQSGPVISSSGLTHAPRNSRSTAGGRSSGLGCSSREICIGRRVVVGTSIELGIGLDTARAAPNQKMDRVITVAGLPGSVPRCEAAMAQGDELVCDGDRTDAMLMSIGSLMPAWVRVTSRIPCQTAANAWPTSVGTLSVEKTCVLPAIQKGGSAEAPALAKIGFTSR